VSARRKKWLILALAWAATAFLIWPILRHRGIPLYRDSRTDAAIAIGYALCGGLLYWFYRAESRRLDRSRALILVILIALLTCFTNQIHHYFVDGGNYFPASLQMNNLEWQERIQAAVTRGDLIAPHVYRFLPNGVVLWMQLLRVHFDAARDIYRWALGLLLFYAIYRFARLYTDYLGGVLALLLVAAVYPMSFEAYAGQLTDPMSHLSFVLAFLFLATADFEYLLSTLIIGALAKETVLAMTGFYVLFCRRDRHYWLKAAILCASTVIAYYGVRLWVLRGTMQYRQISGVDPHHALDNLRQPDWPMAIAILLAYSVFLVIGWRETPGMLKRLALYLIPVLLISNVFFGWLRETRNYMPAVFVLAVIAGRYLSRHIGSAEVAPESEALEPLSGP
jgi:hypothetical protein